MAAETDPIHLPSSQIVLQLSADGNTKHSYGKRKPGSCASECLVGWKNQKKPDSD